jgi:DNA adenine methylase
MNSTPYLFEELALPKIINVASIPQRSPFRYPGGKTWFIPYLRKWITHLPYHIQHFIEPFAGGGSISLTVAFEKLSNHVTMVELDDQVAAVWKTIFHGDGESLAQQILLFDLKPQIVENITTKKNLTLPEKAFQTILRNRVNHGGILAPGAGMIKSGENGKGLASRWYPQTLQKRILAILTIKDRVTFIEGDGLEVIKQHAQHQNVAFFIDPPYTAAGKKAGARLYKCSQINHQELFCIMSQLKSDFLMTYDDTPEIWHLAHIHNFQVRPIAMQNTHHAKMTELLIGRNLDWLN